MSLKTQAKVLRTLDEQRFTPIGSDQPVTVDARVIAATNKDLEEEISIGNFREDLFYRLNVVPFYVPPLRERQEDIPLLARHFLREISAAYSRRSKEISDDAIETSVRQGTHDDKRAAPQLSGRAADLPGARTTQSTTRPRWRSAMSIPRAVRAAILTTYW